MNIKNIITVVIFVVLLILLAVYPKSLKPTEQTELAGQNEWKKYQDSNIGIEFEYPNNLIPNYEKTVYFSECEECPGLINIRADDVGQETLEQALQYNSEKSDLVEKIKIDGTEAFVYIPIDDGKRVENSKIIYTLRAGRLYKISIRSLNEGEDERLLKSIRFPND
ncbi:MAG: hypothetical protein AAB635_01155 [Patescibacteria group bacterium]|mgnify:FL=1